jgi:UPF0716 protein FxsA
MVLIFLVLLVAVPLAELYVIFQVAHQIGVLESIALLIVISVVGGWLVRTVGMGLFVRGMATAAEGRVPTDEMIGGGVVLVAGALMLTPGFLTDAVGLVLLLPPVRAGVIALVRRRVRGRIAQGRASGFATRFTTRVVDVDGVRVWRTDQEEPPKGELR